jgi:hypothetical protein
MGLPNKKLSIKTNPQPSDAQLTNSVTYGSTKSQRVKKSNHSNSPENGPE